MHPPELLKGMLRTIILKLLSEHKRMYGYEMIQAIKDISDSKIDMAVAAIYPVLHKLKDEGALTVEKVNIGERVRIYYTLTPDGNQTAREKAEELADFMHTIKKLMDFKPGLQTMLQL